jgi:propanol-preferring alcohol dehydrogenase
MVLEKPHHPLRLVDLPIPVPAKGQVLIQVHTCGICRTDLHVIDGELPHPKLPLVPGHQIVGTIQKLGEGVENFKKGDRVGVPWLQGSCGQCPYCLSGRENLCDYAVYTGYQVDGGFAEYCVANANFCFPIPEQYDDIHAAPLLCAGLIGYRALRMAGDGKNMGFYGFGAAAHILAQVARAQGRNVYAFTREGDVKAQELAHQLGAVWAGGSDTQPSIPLDSAIIFAPAGPLVPKALAAVGKGGTVVCAGIHMSDIPTFPYRLLWEERVLRSVANLTKQDGIDFLNLAAKIPIQTTVTIYPLEQVNEALDDLRHGQFAGAAVILIKEF